MSTFHTYLFGIFDVGFELRCDWDELSEFWKRYTSYFRFKGDPVIQYTVSSYGPSPAFERTDHGPLRLNRTIDFYLLLEDAFLSDLVAKMSERYPVYHAAVMARHGKATIYLGEPNAGKSTLCVEKLREGWTYLSDEMAVVDGNQVIAVPRPICFNDLENPANIMPKGDERFEAMGYDFVDKEGERHRCLQFLPRANLAEKAGDRFPIEEVVFLESVENGPPVHHVLQGAEKRARLALNLFQG